MHHLLRPELVLGGHDRSIARPNLQHVNTSYLDRCSLRSTLLRPRVAQIVCRWSRLHRD